MKKLIKALSTLLGLIGYTGSAFGMTNLKAIESTSTNTTRKFTSLNNQNEDDVCSRFNELEYKNELSDAEFNEGQMLHEMIEQAGKEPLSYCIMTAANGEVFEDETELH